MRDRRYRSMKGTLWNINHQEKFRKRNMCGLSTEEKEITQKGVSFSYIYPTEFFEKSNFITMPLN